MKKNMFFWIMALMICAVGCADNSTYEPEKLPTPKKLSHEVTQAEARQSLEKIIADMKIPSTRGGEQKSLPPITSVYTTGKPAVETRVGEDVEPYFHIFNFGDNEGFAIMSGDDRVEPLLALTFSGELTPETEIDNPGFEIAYSRMEDYYVAKTMGGPSIDIDIPIPPRDTTPLPDPIETLDTIHLPMGPCPVQWGQQAPYNKFCMYNFSFITPPAGCTRIAVAQLMSIYKYPSSYTNPINNYNTYYFDWDEMNLFTSTDSDTNPYINDTIKIDQIARLIQQLGTNNNLDVHYNDQDLGDPGSAVPTRVPYALRNFGYSSGGDYVVYDTESVVEELRNGYPVLIRGKKGLNGHIWLGHGLLKYSISLPIRNTSLLGEIIWTDPVDTYYILCNWGWNGDYDGYFLSGIFDKYYPYPNSTNDAVIPDELYAIINIRK